MKINEIENNIENYSKNMTVFFNKRTGEIKYVISGIQDMNSFDDIEPDLRIIWDYEILPRNMEVMMNPKSYIVAEGRIYLNSDMKNSIIREYRK